MFSIVATLLSKMSPPYLSLSLKMFHVQFRLCRLPWVVLCRLESQGKADYLELFHVEFNARVNVVSTAKGKT